MLPSHLGLAYSLRVNQNLESYYLSTNYVPPPRCKTMRLLLIIVILLRVPTITCTIPITYCMGVLRWLN